MPPHAVALSWEKQTLKLRNPFRLSYGTTETRQAYWLRLRDDQGWGEGTIPPYYRVDPSARRSTRGRTAGTSAAVAGRMVMTGDENNRAPAGMIG